MLHPSALLRLACGSAAIAKHIPLCVVCVVFFEAKGEVLHFTEFVRINAYTLAFFSRAGRMSNLHRLDMGSDRAFDLPVGAYSDETALTPSSIPAATDWYRSFQRMHPAVQQHVMELAEFKHPAPMPRVSYYYRKMHADPEERNQWNTEDNKRKTRSFAAILRTNPIYNRDGGGPIEKDTHPAAGWEVPNETAYETATHANMMEAEPDYVPYCHHPGRPMYCSVCARGRQGPAAAADSHGLNAEAVRSREAFALHRAKRLASEALRAADEQALLHARQRRHL